MKKLFLMLIVLFIGACGQTARLSKDLDKKLIDAGSLIDYQQNDGVVALNYKNLVAEISFVNDGIFHIAVTHSNAMPERRSYAVTDSVTSPEISIEDNETNITLSTGEQTLTVSKDGLSFGWSVDGEEVTRFNCYYDTVDNTLFIYQPYRGERFFGLGEKTGDLELTGRNFEMWNSDTYRYFIKTDPIYVSIPFYIAVASNRSYGVFYDSPARTYFNFLPENYSYEAADYRTDLYLIPDGDGEDELKSIIEDYTDLTGKPYLPPLWGFGFHQSRYTYDDQAHVLSVAERFRENDLPLDAIYLDIGFMGRKRAFTYDEDEFPDPAAMNAELEEMGVRTIAIVDPGIRIERTYSVFEEGTNQDVFVLDADGENYFKGSVWPGKCYFPDFTNPATQAWWTDQHPALFDIGIDGIWNDMNEPSVFYTSSGTMDDDAIHNNYGDPEKHKYLHNIYGLTMIEMSYAAVDELNGDERVFLLTRAGYAGMQRYSFLWTGDNTAHYKHLQMNVSMALNLGMSGVPFMGADIGGYSASPTEEMFTRWIQLGTFIPFMRDHTEASTDFQEPYEFTNNLDIIRKYMNLRYELLPTLYTYAYLAHESGLPIVRALFLEYGKDYLDVDEEFLFGEDMLICPVLDSDITNLEVIFPDGEWIDYWTGERYTAGSYDVPVTIEDIPVFLRAGSIIPTYATDPASTMELSADTPVTLLITPDADGNAVGVVFRDDLLTDAYESGDFALVRAAYSNGTLAFERRDGDGYSGSAWRVVLPDGVDTLEFDGDTLTAVDGVVELVW